MAENYYGPPSDPTLAAVGQKYKALAPHMAQSEIIRSPKAKGDPRGLEFYPPYESENPRPGKITFELFNKMNPRQTEGAVAADALHYLGGYSDPEQTKPVDPQWLKMKNEMMSFRSPAQRGVDERAFAGGHEPGDTIDKWTDRNRADAYMRAGAFPEQNPEWQLPKGDPEGWTPQQEELIAKMNAYLHTGGTEPPPFEPDDRARSMARTLRGK
jgi:hypothetical protein